MIIDVIDLNLTALQFTRKYDTNRYQRAGKLYRREAVTIEEVKKEKENTYYVEASVEGNYDIYTTTLTIHGNTITDSTCTCEDYNKGNLCKHIIATSIETVNPHYASTEEGQERLDEIEREEEENRQKEIMKKREEERRKREYYYKYNEGINFIESYKSNNKMISTSDINTLDLKSYILKLLKENNKTFPS